MRLKRNVQAIALSGLLLTLTVSAFADATSDARKTISGLYNQQAMALDHKDVVGAFSHFTPDYVGVDVKGHKTTAAVARQNLTSIMGTAKSIQASVTVMQFSLKNNVAIATVKKDVTAVLVDPKTRKPMTLVATNVAKDTWIKTKSGWMEQHSQGISQKATMNGQPIPTS